MEGDMLSFSSQCYANLVACVVADFWWCTTVVA